MVNHSLYWHLATVAPPSNNGFPPPNQHRLVAIGTVTVKHLRSGPEVTLGGKMSGDASKILQWFEREAKLATEIVGIFSDNFGLPVLQSTWKRLTPSGTTEPDQRKNCVDLARTARDIARMTQADVRPGQYLSFDNIATMLGLPTRAPLDIAACCSSAQPNVRRRVVRKTILDAVLIACIDQHLHGLVQHNLPPDYLEDVEEAIIQATTQKMPKAAQRFFGGAG